MVVDGIGVGVGPNNYRNLRSKAEVVRVLDGAVFGDARTVPGRRGVCVFDGVRI